jgi:hypothetical protein
VILPFPSRVALTDPLPDIIPAGGISLLAGAPGVGKTALLASLARDLKRGRPVFGHQPSPIPEVGIVIADRGWDRGAEFWFSRVGYAEIPHYAMADDTLFDPRSLRRKFERTQRLFEFIDRLKLPPGSVVIVDPLSLFLGGNLMDYDGCAVACHEIRALLRQRGLTMLASAHSAKLKADKKDRYLRPQDQILGTTALIGFCDTSAYLASPEEIGKTFYMFLWQPHAVPLETFQLERDDQGLFVPYGGTDFGTVRRVLDLFPADGSLVKLETLRQLAEAIPLSLTTIKRALDKLIEEGKITRARFGAYRRLLSPFDAT